MPSRGRPRSFDRDAALRQAMELFWAKGYAGTSLADLTAAMGINSPSLYAAFGCKERLFREAVELYRETEGLGAWKALDACPTARDAVDWILTQTAEFAARPGKPTGCLVVLGAVPSGGVVSDAGEGPDDPVSRDLCDRRRDNLEALARRLDRGVADGDLPPGVDSRAVATFYLTVQQGMSLQARDGATHDTLLGVARSAMAAWPALTGQK
ncbi:TetR/AcrR family transcriptional regulator [Azospirillum picis]|uniref:AcrR family transcriptional regulator n=1 Tax=Azospirillum picis TaxID=488438 RepID=A0ABU0MMT2_9PROT|nr:TetR/AcrR family transcriptional regulator [Azospirillum picis]MBP2300585.1 AcrR family transcriptional regulator [Azospirillum picis]MDQ0534554.1 AcrR family transcriptional regulator [Azospirillum picis]